jgi:hypothetical protein
MNHETPAWHRTIILVTRNGKSIKKLLVKFIYSFSWIRCFFGLIICNFLFYVRFVRICNIFCDFNDRNTVKSGNIFAPRLCFNDEMQRYTTFIEIYTGLDKDFSTLIENGNSFQFSQAVCAKLTGKLTCFKPREISIMLISL